MKATACTGKRIIHWICGFIALWVASAQGVKLPPDPNNGALLYYQACFMRPEPPNYLMLDNVVRGADPNEEVRKYFNQQKCQETIELARIATQIARCDWGLVYSRGCAPTTPTLAPLSHLARLLGVHARILAYNDEYRPAFNDCLGVRRFASHIGDDTYQMYATSQKVNTEALLAIQHCLWSMPPDAMTLTWLREQLMTVNGTPWRPEKALTSFCAIELEFLLAHREDFTRRRVGIAQLLKDENSRRESQSLSDEELVVHARQSYGEFLRSCLDILGADSAYKEKHARLVRLAAQFEDRARGGDAVAIVLDPIRSAPSYYRLHVHDMALFNAIMAALDIYLIKADAKKLPDSLPTGLPGDPYSGEDFIYETTEGGFVLRCSAIPADSSRTREFEFKVGRSVISP